MTALASNSITDNAARMPPPDGLLARVRRSRRVMFGGALILALILPCLISLPWTLRTSCPLFYDAQNSAIDAVRQPPAWSPAERWFGTDALGRSLLGRCLLGGAISLAIGLAAATISIILGVSVGVIAGYRGGWIDSLLMRSVDVLYGLPYILLVILFKIAFESPLAGAFGAHAANLIVLFLAIGLVSWLTMSRVVRGQVLSLRSQPFVEAARALGLTERRIFLRHILPNLAGPIIVYATLTVPQAILQESFLSFLGVGIAQPMPTWGELISEGLNLALADHRWWMLVFPCVLLATTLLCLNFIGDGLRDVLDPKREAAKI